MDGLAFPGGVRTMNYQQSAPAELEVPVPDEKQHDVIRREQKRIQDSHAFCNSPRAKEFLSYVIENVLEGRIEQLKERSIGVNLFHRAPTYVTGRSEEHTSELQS